MESEKVKRVLPADVYDTLELSALAFGGIGAGRAFERSPWVTDFEDKDDPPVCLYGHWAFSCEGFDRSRSDYRLYVTAPESDDAVRAINTRKGLPPDDRVSWPEYTAETGIVRGEQ